MRKQREDNLSERGDWGEKRGACSPEEKRKSHCGPPIAKSEGVAK